MARKVLPFGAAVTFGSEFEKAADDLVDALGLAADQLAVSRSVSGSNCASESMPVIGLPIS